jgi:hypothetical protein
MGFWLAGGPRVVTAGLQYFKPAMSGAKCEVGRGMRLLPSSPWISVCNCVAKESSQLYLGIVIFRLASPSLIINN